MGKFDGILFLSDMDGTLLHNAKLSEENRKAIEYFTENGGLFTVATGRAPEFIKKFNLKINAPIISINGTIIYDLKNEHIIKDYFLMPEMIDAAKFAAENLPVIRFSFFLETSEMRVLPQDLDFEKVKGTLRKVVFVFEEELKEATTTFDLVVVVSLFNFLLLVIMKRSDSDLLKGSFSDCLGVRF